MVNQTRVETTFVVIVIGGNVEVEVLVTETIATDARYTILIHEDGMVWRDQEGFAPFTKSCKCSIFGSRG